MVKEALADGQLKILNVQFSIVPSAFSAFSLSVSRFTFWRHIFFHLAELEPCCARRRCACFSICASTDRRMLRAGLRRLRVRALRLSRFSALPDDCRKFCSLGML
jgi:hypothetical protein